MQRKIKIKEMIKASKALKFWQDINKGYHMDYTTDTYKVALDFMRNVL